jgi:hypothetical protein
MIANAAGIVMESPPSPLHTNGVFSARSQAHAMTAPMLLREREPFFLAVRGAIESASRIAAVAEKQALELEKTATRRGPHERIGTKSFFATLRKILKAAGVSVAVGTDAEAGIANEKRPLVRLARLMLRFALDRIDKDNPLAREEVEFSANLSQIAFIRLVRSSKIT